ncbi:uncharacterized protein LOC110707602 [Chenopodium quinoa]|uniref:uncharacterized protein LOC110707602 n=1 Tax=Chenopodium quinoa TaxID=63459 RepID=UPI000B7724F0|nr:uncharacterized protein LOC110707602 [Chenopodium quinoa]
MRWHNKGHAGDDDDGIMRHPRDSKSWKSLDELYPEFAADARNVRLALDSDGFNPGANMSSRYSIWPVMLVPYNLPPWMCMKRDNMMLSLLIPGPKSPGNDIDVFLQPLIDELKELWESGVQTFDAHSKETFNMRAVLMWTISDFPAYANLSGWSTKGAKACPNCHKDTNSEWLKHGHKWCYMCHRVFLEPDHKWRLNKRFFSKKVERRAPPNPLSGNDALEQLHGYPNVEFGKDNKGKRKRGERYIVHQWKKISVFFNCLIRDICTFLDLPGKNKDSVNARLDLEAMKMHDDLRPKKVRDKYQIPRAPFNLTLHERRKIVTFLSKLAFPDGYSSNISRCASLQDGKIIGMKTYDFHVFMQDLLTLTFQGVLDEKVLEPLRELSLFFKQLCAKTLKVADLERMEANIAITLCKLERIFVLAFFDVMIHLPIHLATEAKLAGPVHYRWMYRFERYLSKIETQFNRLDQNEDMNYPQLHSLSVFYNTGKTLGKPNLKQLSIEDWRKAQLYVLQNCEEAQPFFDEYENDIGHRDVEFCKWFENRIIQLWEDKDERVTEELLCLARGPMKRVVTFDGYVINGFRFHTKKRQRHRKTQNSGVVVLGDAESGGKDFYGTLDEVIVLEYDALENRTSPKVVLFRCKCNKLKVVKNMKDHQIIHLKLNRILITSPYLRKLKSNQ